MARFGPIFGISEVLGIYLATFMLCLLPSSRTLPLQLLSLVWIIPAALVLRDLLCGKTGDSLNRTLAMAALTHLIFGLSKILQVLFV